MIGAHTPGPWRSNDFSQSVYGYIFGDNQAICRIFLDGDECEANGRLIAAAPDLLEALLLFTSGPIDKRTYEAARAAIAKATNAKPAI